MKEDLIKWLDDQIEFSKEEVKSALDEKNVNRHIAMRHWLAALVHVKVNYAELLNSEPNDKVIATQQAMP